MHTVQKSSISRVNGLNLEALGNVVERVSDDPAKGIVGFRVSSSWQGQTLSEHKVNSYRLGGETIPRNVCVKVDQPVENLGTDTAPNPQELLMSALNACMIVGYVAGASIRGITLELLEIETDGELDLRGFLGISRDIKPGYDQLRYKVRLKGNGSAAEFREIHETVMQTSPTYFNIAKPVELHADLEILDQETSN